MVGLGLTDTDHDIEAGVQSSARFGTHQGIIFAMAMAPLGMAEKSKAAAGIDQHAGTDISGEGAFAFNGAILAT